MSISCITLAYYSNTYKLLFLSLKKIMKSIETARTPSKAYEYVVSGIREGKYPPASKISDRDIAKELDMGHMTVREAMSKLEEHGWIERIPHKGAFVRQFFDSRDIRHIYLAREVIEEVAVRDLAENITADQIEQLRQCCEKLEAACRQSDVESYFMHDMQFHSLSVLFSGNKQLYTLFKALILQGNFVFEKLVAKTVQTNILNYGDSFENAFPSRHRDILKAIEYHDPEVAGVLVKRHIQFGYEIIIKELKNNDKTSVFYQLNPSK